MRTFTAIWPPQEATRHLAAAVETVRSARPDQLARATGGLRGFRFVPPERWHLTLCFHGDDADPERLEERLTRRLARVARQRPSPRGPRLRMAGGGVFRGVLWIGVEPAGDGDAAVLRMLAGAAGADPDSFRAHLTVARWASGRAQRNLLSGLFEDYAGPWWGVREIAIVCSERQEGALAYRTAHRVALTHGRPGDQA